ncbi:hypothetical protein Gotur_019774 [Gossypium turneri]
MSQTWSYKGCILYCQYHIPDMVLHGSSHIGAHAMSQTWSYGGTFHLGANAMSQTWSYMGPLITSITPMSCPRHSLTWDLIPKMS